MAELKRYFDQFNEAIRLKQYDENEILREKRDAVLRKLKCGLKELFEKKKELPPKYTKIDQGSYSLGTGVKPLKGDFDIDVGLLFDVSKNDYSDPVVIKGWVYDSLEGHTKRVEMRKSCITVLYQVEEEPVYHVDLAVYSAKDANDDRKTYLARGKQSSKTNERFWEEADPDGLEDTIRKRFSADEWDQFRRCIRYLKRWKDLKFPTDGNAAPVGIGFTISAHYWFAPVKKYIDTTSGKMVYDDLKALAEFLDSMENHFTFVNHDDESAKRLVVTLPVVPGNDVFSKMTNKQMEDFRESLKELRTALNEAGAERDPIDACKRLRKVFGDDFPVPDKDDTAQKRGPAIITTSHSG